VRWLPALACAVALAASDARAVEPYAALHIESSETDDSAKGEIRATVDHPFPVVGAALREPAQWCEILILHLNVKYCRASVEAPGTRVRVIIGKKFDQPIEDAYPVDFEYRVAQASAHVLQVTLRADSGPLGTRDYLIVLDAAPAQGDRTLLRMSYSYAYGMGARLAMQAYLATIGRAKVGFTVVGTDSNGAPRYIGGMRGVTERNTMRYYLAVNAFLGSLSTSPAARVEKGLQDWFSAIERYPLQLHEMERRDYLVMKRAEHARQVATIPR
jgi:hypothetical protein